MATVSEYREEPVRSRVHWGPILGGAAVAFALYFLLTLLGTAIGLTIDQADPGAMAVGAGIWATVAILIALFVGGWVTTRCAVGLDTTEAALHGAIVWGLVFILLLWLLAAGMGMGFNVMVGMAGGQQQQQAAPGAAAQPAQQAQPADPMQQIMAPGAREDAAQAAWWAFIGTLLSIGAAIGGAILGRGASERASAHYRPPAGAPVGRRAPAG